MIYAFVGTDTEKRSAAVSAFLGKSSGTVIRFNDTGDDPGRLHDLIGGGDLFGGGYVIVIDSILDSGFGEAVMGQLERLAESTNTFVIIETAIPKARLAEIAEVAENVAEFAAAKKKSDAFNIFSITDAFGARDKKNSWVLMQKALRQDISAEEILNILIWQVKNLLLAKGAKSMKETGLSPFVHDKSLKYSNNFEAKELEGISRDLAKLYHESHLGLDLGPNLELFLLKTL